MGEYIKYPKTLLQAGNELKKIIDNYWDGKVTETMAKDYVRQYAEMGMLLQDDGIKINPSILAKIGKKRQKVVQRMLGNYKISFTEKLR